MNSKIRVLIVDDEIPSRKELIYLLEENFLEKINIIGEAEHGLSAVEKINELKPDVVFLDIDMPVINGLEVAQIALSVNPEILIVFVTAFDDYALKAFEVHAVDYLVKPFSLSRLQKTIDRLLQEKIKINNGKMKEIIHQLDNYLPRQKINKISCDDNGRIILFTPEEIYYCNAEDGRSYVSTKKGKFKTFFTLNDLEDRLGFFRAHRSFLVNLDYIQIIEPWFNSSFRLIINDELKTEITVSRIQSKKLKELLAL